MARKEPEMRPVGDRVFVLHYEGKPGHLVKSGYSHSRPSKRTYFTVGDAKSGIHHLPEWMDRTKITIVPYVPEAPLPVQVFVVRKWTEYALADGGPIAGTKRDGEEIFFSREDAVAYIEGLIDRVRNATFEHDGLYTWKSGFVKIDAHYSWETGEYLRRVIVLCEPGVPQS